MWAPLDSDRSMDRSSLLKEKFCEWIRLCVEYNVDRSLSLSLSPRTHNAARAVAPQTQLAGIMRPRRAKVSHECHTRRRGRSSEIAGEGRRALLAYAGEPLRVIGARVRLRLRVGLSLQRLLQAHVTSRPKGPQRRSHRVR